jgi:hypothetical protein
MQDFCGLPQSIHSNIGIKYRFSLRSFLVDRWSQRYFDFGLDHPTHEGYIYEDLALQVGGWLEYLHRSLASRKRRIVRDGVKGTECLGV